MKLRMVRTLVAELCDQVEIILSEQHGSRDQIRRSGNPPLQRIMSAAIILIIVRVIFIQGNLVNTTSIVIDRGPVYYCMKS